MGLREDADRVAGALVADQPGRRARAALELIAVHPGAAADRSLLQRPRRGRLQRVDGRLLGDVVAVDVVQVAVPGLGGHRAQPAVGGVRWGLDRPRADSAWPT